MSRDSRIHGLVLDEGNPGPTLRELLRQWSESGLTPPGDLADRTRIVLDVIGTDGRVLAPTAAQQVTAARAVADQAAATTARNLGAK